MGGLGSWKVPKQAKGLRPARGRMHAGRRRWTSESEGMELAELNDRVGYFLRRLQVAVFKDFIRTLAPVDVRPAQYSILVLVAANPGRSQAAIGKALNIERARLARMLHELERRQWIERRVSSGDGRSHSLYMTAGGQGRHGPDHETGSTARAADGQIDRAQSCANCCWTACKNSADRERLPACDLTVPSPNVGTS